MENDYIDDDGTISISRLLCRPALPPDDPRYISRDLRNLIIKHRIAQIHIEGEVNAAALRKARLCPTTHDDKPMPCSD